MRVFLILLNIPALILMPVIWLIRWIVSFAVSMSHWIFYLGASLLFLLGFVLLIFQEATFGEIIPLLALSFILYVLPHIALWLANALAEVNARLRAFVQS